MLTHAQILENWFNSMDKDLRLTLFGPSLAKVYATAKTGKIATDQIKLSGLPEIPLSGPAYTDYSLSYILDSVLKGDIVNSALNDTLPLIKKIATVVPVKKSLFMEFDAGSGNDTAHPSLFFKTGKPDSADGLIALFKQESPHPRRWEMFEKIWGQIKGQWRLVYIGLMPRRKDSPVRIILSPDTQQPHDNPVEELEALFTALGYPFPHSDVLQKFDVIWQINRTIPYSASYTLCLDLLPDGTWGKTIGMEIFQELLNGKKQIIASYREKLIHQFRDWQLADERVNLLGDCEKMLLIPDSETEKKYLLCSYLNHFKLRWQDDNPLPVKAYFQLHEV